MKRYILILTVSMMALACSKNTFTHRNQLNLYSEAELQQMANTEYRATLAKSKVVSPSVSKDAEMVTRVGNRIANAVNTYFRDKKEDNPYKDYKWEFNLVDDKQVNAWCMPGGKVVVYTGLLPVAQNEAALAVVMGHEITHALAKHGNERMSQGMLQELGGVALSVAVANKPAETQNIFMTAYGVGTTVGGILPFSRKQELEADHYGLILCAVAGYNPREAVPFWERMQKMSNGQEPPELLSTHPSDETRIEQVKKYSEEAMKYYKPMNK